MCKAGPQICEVFLCILFFFCNLSQMFVCVVLSSLGIFGRSFQNLSVVDNVINL